MGIYYTHHLVPGPGFIDRRFDASMVATVLEVLAREGFADRGQPPSWRAPGGGKPVAQGQLRWERLADDLRAAAPTGAPLSVGLKGAAKDTTEDEYFGWIHDPELGPAQCQSILVRSLTEPSVVDAGSRLDGPIAVRCPRCAADPTQRPGARGLDLEARFLAIEGVDRLLPAACPACEAALDPSTLTARSRSPMTGEPIDVVAPFYRFGIELTPDAKGCPSELARVPASLTTALWNATGVAFRSLGSVG